MRFWSYFAIGFTALANLAAQPARRLPALVSDTTTFDLATGEAVLKGNASLVQDGTSLHANEIRYNDKTRTASARGNVILQQLDRRLLADEVIYRFDDKSFDVKNLRAGLDPIYVSGTRVQGSGDVWTLEDATAHVRELGPWTPVARAKSLVLRADRSMEMVDGWLGLGSINLLPLPGFPIPVDEVFLRYLTLGAGYRKSLGAFVEVGTQLPIAPGVELGGDVGYFTSRGIMAGPSGRYARQGEDRSISGTFRSGFIHDSGDKQRDVLGQRIAEDRAFFHWEHRQRVSSSLSLVADVDYWSDSEVLRDFRPKEFYPVQQTDTFVQAEYVAPSFVLNGLTRLNLNRYFQVQERLPEVQFLLLPRSIGTRELGIFQRGAVSLVRLREDAVTTGPTLKSDRFNAHYSLSRPWPVKEWLTLTPVGGAQVTHYANTSGTSGDGTYTRTLEELGVDAEMRASATFDYKNPTWKIDGLRHLITPRLSYRYVPSAEKGRRQIPQIDRRAFSTYLQPLGLGDQRNVDELDEQNTLRFQIDNTLQTRDAHYGSRDLIHFNLALDAKLERAGSARTLSDLHTELNLTPAAWLRFDLYQRFSTYDGKLRELNTGLTVTNSDWWKLRLGTHYLESNIEEYVAEGDYRLNEVYELFARLHYDSRQARFVQQTYGVHHTLDNLWVLSYGFNFYEGRRREGSFGFVVEVEAARF
ncbi:MAG: LPS-assembly protein LptD [Opitutaceae bacterium]|nr:LPS-assembly protein LptD [Opitutaceae bacterium]